MKDNELPEDKLPVFKACSGEGGITVISFTETSWLGPEHNFKVVKTDEPAGFHITFKPPTKPIWEQLGYKSPGEYFGPQHLHYMTKDGYFCHTCGDVEINECKLNQIK